MRITLATILAAVFVSSAFAQDSQRRFEIQKPRDVWQQPGEIQKPRDVWQQPGEIQKPRDVWQQPGEIQKPRDVWQQPGEIQVPKGIEAVRASEKRCERRLSVVADALFDFDKSELRKEAEETLTVIAPEITKSGKGAARIEGHTDAIGGGAYNMRLSEARARTVRDWLAARGVVPPATPIKGFGKTKPVAPNKTADGKDDPLGRQKNRRVEVVVNTCA